MGTIALVIERTEIDLGIWCLLLAKIVGFRDSACAITEHIVEICMGLLPSKERSGIFDLIDELQSLILVYAWLFH